MAIVEVKDIKDILNDKSEARLLSFMQKKAQKIIKASYIITEPIKDTEPLRSEVRTLAHTFLKDINVLALGLSGSSGEAARSALATLKILEVLIEAGVIASFWPLDIGAIIKGELEQIGMVIERRLVRPGLIQEPVTRDFFGVEMPVEAEREVKVKRPEGAVFVPDRRSSVSSGTRMREEVILGVIGKLGSATIKDIMREARFPEETGEKTVQRELLSLLSGGRIERRGERRWSRYALPGGFV